MFPGNKLININRSKVAAIFISLVFTTHILKLTLTILTPNMNQRSLLTQPQANISQTRLPLILRYFYRLSLCNANDRFHLPSPPLMYPEKAICYPRKNPGERRSIPREHKCFPFHGRRHVFTAFWMSKTLSKHTPRMRRYSDACTQTLVLLVSTSWLVLIRRPAALTRYKCAFAGLSPFYTFLSVIKCHIIHSTFPISSVRNVFVFLELNF